MTITVTYRIHLASEAATAAARRSLEAQGFSVESAPGESTSSHALDALIDTAEGESDASSRLDAALRTIDHDPVIEYQIERLKYFRD